MKNRTPATPCDATGIDPEAWAQSREMTVIGWRRLVGGRWVAVLFSRGVLVIAESSASAGGGVAVTRSRVARCTEAWRELDQCAEEERTSSGSVARVDSEALGLFHKVAAYELRRLEAYVERLEAGMKVLQSFGTSPKGP